jgi:hypothetical protein
VTWTQSSKITTGNLRDIAWGAGNFVIVSDGHYEDPFPVILFSPDGNTWTEADPKTALPLCSVVWEDNQFVAGGYDGTKVISPNGKDWTDVSAHIEYPPVNALCEENGVYVGVGSNGYITYSTDLTNWSVCEPVTGDHLTSIASDGTQFIAAGRGSLLRNTSLLSGGSITPVSTQAPTPEPSGGNVTHGDVNNNGNIDIIDALLVAQHYVGLEPAGFNPGAADVNCSNAIDIVDALLIARYYVGLITTFPC